jgi:hypothetical protein
MRRCALRSGWRRLVDDTLQPGQAIDGLDDPAHVDLLIVGEAGRPTTLRQEVLRCAHDGSGIRLVTIGTQGLEKRLARYPQLSQRVGFATQ